MPHDTVVPELEELKPGDRVLLTVYREITLYRVADARAGIRTPVTVHRKPRQRNTYNAKVVKLTIKDRGEIRWLVMSVDKKRVGKALRAFAHDLSPDSRGNTAVTLKLID